MFAKPGTSLMASAMAVLMASTWASGQKVFYSKPELANPSTGMMESKVAGIWYRGSGVVARDPKLLFSCAHVFNDQGEWATDYVFYRAWHDRSFPGRVQGMAPRGLHYFTSYSDGVNAFGSESNVAFASDFTVLYGNSDFGPAAAVWQNSGSALRSSRLKRIVGYPSDIDFTGRPGFCYQHSTGWFNYGAYRIRGAYHEFDDVSTGPGNSGGPIFLSDGESGGEKLAGILVSGDYRMAGVVALDPSTETLAGYALGKKERTRVFTNRNRLFLPDGGRNYSVRNIAVSGFSGSISRILFQMSANTPGRGELDVFLRSPAGKIRWILKRGADTSGNFEITDMDLTGTFGGASANGQWKLFMQDAAGGSRATFGQCSLTITAF